MSRRFGTVLTVLSLVLIFPADVRSQIPTPTALPGVEQVLCPAGGCVDDPIQRSFIERFKAWIHDALNGGGNLAQRLADLIGDLIAYLKTVIFEIHKQGETSKCHTPDCKEYGYRTPTPG